MESIAITFYAGIGAFGEQYTVTVITDPPSGPFLAGDRIDFTCHVDPVPPEPVTYSWHAMTNAHDSTLPGQKTTHYTPSYGDLHFSWFFCKVFFNERFMGVGRRQVEIQKAQTFAIVACYNNY